MPLWKGEPSSLTTSATFTGVPEVNVPNRWMVLLYTSMASLSSRVVPSEVAGEIHVMLPDSLGSCRLGVCRAPSETLISGRAGSSGAFQLPVNDFVDQT